MTDHRNESHPRLDIAEVNGNLSLHDFLTHVISLCSSGIDRTDSGEGGRARSFRRFREFPACFVDGDLGKSLGCRSCRSSIG